MKWPVFSDVKEAVDSAEIIMAQSRAGHQRLSQIICCGPHTERAAARIGRSKWIALFEPVVGSFASDDHVVNVAFAQARGRDTDKLAAFVKLLQVCCAAITHPATQTTYELIDECGKGPFVGNLALDAFGDGFTARYAFLRVAVRRARLHGAERTHAAVGLECAPLVQDGLAGGFLGAGEETANHYGRCAGGDRFGDVAGKFNSAVSDDRN